MPKLSDIQYGDSGVADSRGAVRNATLCEFDHPSLFHYFTNYLWRMQPFTQYKAPVYPTNRACSVFVCVCVLIFISYCAPNTSLTNKIGQFLLGPTD